MKRTLIYTVREVSPYINWIYYFHAWGIESRFATIVDVHNCPACRTAWIDSFSPNERTKARESIKLYDEAIEQLRKWADESICHASFFLANAYSEGDDIVVDNRVRIPFFRQQRVGKSGYTLCLSDFIKGHSPLSSSNNREKSTDIANTIGVFATTTSFPQADSINLPAWKNEKGARLQLSILSDRLAEATAEKMHEEIRKHYWGYAKDEFLTMRELHEEKFQGIRPAVGYPSLPDQSINFLIDELLHLSEIGITLSDNGAMIPHSSITGFLLAHPQAQYFAVGDISQEQLRDYARRRAVDIEQAEKFVTGIINT